MILNTGIFRRVPYLNINNYNQLNSQVNYMKDNKFGGAFVCTLDLDDFKGEFCGEGSHPLLSQLRKLINNGKSSPLHLHMQLMVNICIF